MKAIFPPVYIITYDKSLFFLKTTAHQFNKYWGDWQRVIVLGYKKPAFNLPKNFEFISMGKDQGPNDWSRPIYEILKKVSDEYIFFTMDDEPAIDHLKPHILEDLFGRMKKDDKIVRAGIGFGPSQRPHLYNLKERKIDYDIYELKQSAPYRITTQFSLWRTQYLLKYLNKKQSAWDFELKGSEAAKKDEKVILGTARDFAFRWIGHGSLSRRNNGKVNLLGMRLSDIKELVAKKKLDKSLIQFGQDIGPLYSEVGQGFQFDSLRDFNTPEKFYDYKLQYGKYYQERTPPLFHIPYELIDSYTLGGRARLEHNYFDTSHGGEKFYPKDEIDSNVKKAKIRQLGRYQKTDKWFYEALDKYPLVNKSVAIMGSTSCYYEAIALAFRGTPVTIEYNKRGSDHPKLRFLTVKEYDDNPEVFDTAFSISSFEHDGLGRYGDPIDPFGDLKAMDKMKKIVKRNGLLYLSIPVGVDKILWNAHRVYGQYRLPLLLAGWRVVESFGFDNSLFRQNLPGVEVVQPVFVLKNI